MAEASAAQAGISAVGGIAKFFEGQQMTRDAQNYIRNFKWQDLQNPWLTQQVSKLGSQLQTEQADLAASQDIAALRQAGTRGLVGGLPQVEANRNLVNRNLAANLDEQQKAINQAAAQQAVANQQMIEQRQENALAGYGTMLNVGLGMRYQGINDIVNAGGLAGQAGQGMFPEGFGGFTPQVQSQNQLTPQGLESIQPTPMGGMPTGQLPDWAKTKF